MPGEGRVYPGFMPVEQLLFIHATLQNHELQLDTFGRVPTAEPDVLPGYTVDFVEVLDCRFSDQLGTTRYPQVRATGDPLDKVTGLVLHIDDAELKAADQIEASLFWRRLATLGSGREAWVYVSA